MENIKNEIIKQLQHEKKRTISFRDTYIERKFNLSHEDALRILLELISEGYLFLRYEIRIDLELWKIVDDYKPYIGFILEPNETELEINEDYTISEENIYLVYYLNKNKL